MKVHLIGIGGTGMASLAGLLSESGHIVSGSDGKIYPPMSDLLADLKVKIFEGYEASHIAAAKPDLVIIGNVIRRENPEAQEAINSGVEYTSMPVAISSLYLKDRTPLVITGTHGKTTISSLVAWLVKSCDFDPGYLIGGISRNFNKNYAVGKDNYFIIEGDEYDTAFFDKGPKFLHYRPQAVIISSIEFDHGDIYSDIDQILKSFRRLVEIVPPDGVIIANGDDPNVSEVVKNSACRVITYGKNPGNTYYPKNVRLLESSVRFEISNIKGYFEMKMWGEHNILNAVGSIAMLTECGMPSEKLAKGLSTFTGVRRRQEIVHEAKGVTIIDDFAHHPTAVKKTIESVRQRFGARRLWAIFEPRSNTSRRNFFQNEYSEAFSEADRILIAHPYRENDIPAHERLDVEKIASSLHRMGKDAHSISSTENIVEYVMRGVDHGDIILVMSNGAFDGITSKLAEGLKCRRIINNRSEITPSRVPK
ncbi:MAG TPA: Mur ligase family protein [bacterium]|jgi:UDP-N-acetylmuramate: L-alanyl-gamma-D-glutamyl-meso-diaminopimelate ligase|nr:hypothetical protein [Myxococcales bacterium]OQA59293.1 MAG: UDP-N-acetylmuramate:L-alanyl-gamma-D-glutamyl-meso-diaminopimelate ligase [bacterium ADurb.Bin270]HPW45885.1 Mur ligase family protein [bacterium]HQC50398.1 Mur ligase family protein [bacterium]